MQNLLGGKLAQNLEKAQAEMKAQRFEGRAGGDWVKAVVDGEGTIQSLKINPDCVHKDDLSLLEDLICSALRSAGEKQKEWIKSRSLNLFG